MRRTFRILAQIVIGLRAAPCAGARLQQQCAGAGGGQPAAADRAPRARPDLFPRGPDRRYLHGEPHRPAEHRFLENTLAAFSAAFAAGADIVEFDVHPTTDGAFVVFHDWTLDCRTDGHGGTREHSLAELKALDVGYGYTADGGKTFPFRGAGVGLMPTLDEVLAAFPGRRFLINVKSDDPSEAGCWPTPEIAAPTVAR